jgi:hypothetical protein
VAIVARRAKRKVAAKAVSAAPPAAVPLVVNPFGPTKQRDIIKSKVLSSQFTLSDRTKIVITPRVSDVRRAIDQYNQEGHPLYFLTMGYEIKTYAPKSLLKKQPRKKVGLP